jgi:hypothetical protein
MEAVWRLVSQSGDGDPLTKGQDLNEGQDRLETTSNAGSESAASYATQGDVAQGDEVLLPCAHNNSMSMYGQPREPRWSAPAAVDQYEHHAPQWAKDYNSRPENGNCGWAFANGGARAKHKKKQEYIDKLLKRSPAIILGLAECDHATDLMLCAPGEPAAATTGSLVGIEASLARASHEYVTIRGSEKHSLLLGVRKNNCRSLQLKQFLVKDEGTYRAKGANKNKLQAATRALIADVSTHRNVGFIGSTHTVMVVHLHFTVAKGMQGKKKQKDTFIKWFLQAIIQYNVTVVMGDFNMAFWEITGWVRSKHPDMAIDLAAWYGWKSFDGIPCSDSCGIWILNTPGMYTLVKDVTCITEEDDNDETSLLAAGKTFTHKPVKKDDGGWARFSMNIGPGVALHCYQPDTRHATKKDKHNNLARIPPTTQIRESLTPSAQSADWANKYTRRGKTSTGTKECFRAKQVPLHFEGFCSDEFGQQGGAHYPICVMTGNNSTRPPQKHVARHKDNDNKLRHLGLLPVWTPVVRTNKMQGTAVAEEWDVDWWQSRSYGKRRDAWDEWRQGSWEQEGQREWTKEKENRGWSTWGNDADNAQDRWAPRKVHASSAARRISPERPDLPPQPVLSPVPSPDLVSPVPSPPVPAVEPPAVDPLPLPLHMPQLPVPVSSASSWWTFTAEGKWRHTNTFWSMDGQSGSHSVDYDVSPTGNIIYPDLGAETGIQRYNHAGEEAGSMCEASCVYES